jgi:superfamily II DNA or RNA helicase/HKD family nuclease
MMSSDLTFITNEENCTLCDRFNQLIKDSRYFDVLVGYFYTSGFHALYPALETTEKIRILIGIGTGKDIVDLIGHSKENEEMEWQFSHTEVKECFEREVTAEMEDSEDNLRVEEGIERFISWLKSGKLEIRAYPSRNIHAKLYIMTFKEGDRDFGRVITGSSNFTQSGLSDNLELNVELKNRSDYEFAAAKFESLWINSVDVGEKYINSVETHTWLNPNITPYQLYLKFLYEYFKDELSLTDEVFVNYLPQGFKKYDYQQQAVLNAKKIVEEYGGVFISDVVGLGKTYIATMLAGQLDGRTLVIAPPALLDRSNPGSWPNVFSDFHIPADFESVGKLELLLKRGVEKYANVIIDEAHRFRTEATIGFDQLAQICRGKRVILISATPYNNSPMDILSQIKLFQNPRMSTIPNLPNLEGFFKERENWLKKINKQQNYDEYLRMTKENAREIRDRVLKYLMVRRTRTEIEKYFPADVEKQKLKFPEIQNPTPLYYELNNEEDAVFNESIRLITQQSKYVRYTPLLYYKDEISQIERLSQKNLASLMKVLLVKRLESSFHAFRCTIDRFIHSYEMFIKTFDEGSVYVSKKYAQKIFDLLEEGDDEAVQLLIDENKAEKYDSSDFNDQFRDDLQNDLDILKKIQQLWQNVKRDPKLEKLQHELLNNAILKDKKIILFTESKETAEYLTSNIKDKVICYHGNSGENIRDIIIENFDARAKNPKNDYRILIATEVLSEGVNLHRSNVVINYDIPWNPTRMMQRVGRINRVDTPFDTIYTFNFFPTVQSEDQIKLRKTAEAKINAFLTLLGGDAALLTEGEPVTSHELFNRLISKQTLTGEVDMGES